MLTIFAISQDGIHAVTGAIFQNNTQYSEMNINFNIWLFYLLISYGRSYSYQFTGRLDLDHSFTTSAALFINI